MKRIAILGSTGSIGVNALKVVASMPGEFEVVGLSARSNASLLGRQARRFGARLVSLFEPEAARELKSSLKSSPTPENPRGVAGVSLNGSCRHLPPGVEGLMELASHPEVDLVLTSLVGGVGFAPLLAAIRAGKTIALANKEPMVMAGAQFMREAQRWKARIVPVDSEPSAIFQCLQSRADPAGLRQGPRAGIRRVFLTASGGAFYRRKGSLDRVTVAQALAHPTWKMGKKITIDCATLMNKGFESIEIMHLFGLGHKAIEIVIHPQSIVHSAVEFSDGSVLAQMSPPDMRLPIQYAMTYPSRGLRLVRPLDLVSERRLTFDQPDFRRFPCLALARAAARAGAGAPAVLNAADEVAVAAFLEGRIAFTGIARVVERTLAAYSPGPRLPSFSEVVEIDQWARRKAQECL